MNNFIKIEINKFGSGINMYQEYIAPNISPKITLDNFSFKFKNLDVVSKIK